MSVASSAPSESKVEETMSSEESVMESHHTQQPPELEFNMSESEESLTAYLSAIGGAVIGLLLTLLVLAIWNGGTLNFTNTSKVDALDANMTRVDENMAAMSTDLETLGERLAALEGEAGALAQLRDSLTTFDSSLAALDQSLSDQGIHITELDLAVAELQVTRRNFDTFTSALIQVLAEMETNQTGAAPVPMIVTSEDVAADTVLVYLFVDANANSVMDGNEIEVAGTTIALTGPEGESVVAETSEDSGARFEELVSGEYTVSVEDALGYELVSASAVAVTINAEAEAGQIVYYAVMAGAGE